MGDGKIVEIYSPDERWERLDSRPAGLKVGHDGIANRLQESVTTASWQEGFHPLVRGLDNQVR
jgi:hypothetical protein